MVTSTNSNAPFIHHAEHLATLRKACAKDPLAILKKFKYYKLQNESKIHTPTGGSGGMNPGSKHISKPKTKTKSNPIEKSDFSGFDNLDEITESKGMEAVDSDQRATGKAAKFAI